MDQASLAGLRALLSGSASLEVVTQEGALAVGEGELDRVRRMAWDIYLDRLRGEERVRGRRLALARSFLLRDLLGFFLERRPGTAIETDTLFRCVWGGVYDPLRHDRMVYAALGRLRDLLRRAAREPLLERIDKSTWALRGGLATALVREASRGRGELNSAPARAPARPRARRVDHGGSRSIT